jgi:hydroxymethylpyrimidine kinase/phosphomethylpyrimidine kinase/thiamine-phosphate diphosphorylase
VAVNIQTKKMPVVWTVGSSNCSGDTGIQSDVLTFHDFAVHGCTIVTAVNAQNSFAQGYSTATERKNMVAQINALDSDLPAQAIKLGVLPNQKIVDVVIKYLADYDGFVVYDLELNNSGDTLLTEAKDLIIDKLLPRIDLLVANTKEVETLSGIAVTDKESMLKAADYFISLGARSVLVTGASFDAEKDLENPRHDYWTDGSSGLWLTVDAIKTVNNRGGGGAFTAAIAAMLGRGEAMETALTTAKAYVTQGIRGSHQNGNGPGAIAHLGWPENDADKPLVSVQSPA